MTNSSINKDIYKDFGKNASLNTRINPFDAIFRGLGIDPEEVEKEKAYSQEFNKLTKGYISQDEFKANIERINRTFKWINSFPSLKEVVN